MVLLRFLGRLCASGTDAAETHYKQNGYQSYYESALQRAEHTPVANDLAVGALHRLLSGLGGTSFQRIEGMLNALRSTEVTGATYVALFAVPEVEHAGEETPLVLLQSARDTEEDSDAEDGATHLPDPQQAGLFKKMLQEKVPIRAVLERCYYPLPSYTASSMTRPPELPSANSASPASSPNPRPSRRMSVAAVPLLHGSKLAGAVWLEKPQYASKAHGRGSAEGVAGTGGRQGTDEPEGLLLSDPHALKSLSFACSMCMLGPEGSNAAWLAAALARLGSSDSMSALTANLCAAMTAHVRRRFLLDAVVIAALVPPGPDMPLALLLQPVAASASAVANGSAGPLGSHMSNHTHSGGTPAGAGADPTRLADAPVDRLPGSGGNPGSKIMCRSPARGGHRCSSANIALFAQLQLGASAPTGQSPLDQSGLSATMSKRRIRQFGTSPNGILRDPAAIIQARFSLDLCPRSPSVGPTASSRSIIIPLPHPPPQNHAGECGSYAAAAATGTPALHAKAFPLQRTLLQAHLQQQQQHQQSRQRQDQGLGTGCLASGPDASSGVSGGCGENASTPAARAVTPMQPISSLVGAAVIEDTQLHVQNVHKPSNDVCMLMGLTRRTANGMLGGNGPGCGASSYGNVLASGTGTGMLSAGLVAAPGNMNGAIIAAGAIPQSLVLLSIVLGEDGAALGLYLCFPKRLPGQLLEAVRVSCQELMDKALGPVTRGRLKDAIIAPEYETLCNANPGSYAVMRSASFCGLQAPPGVSAAYMSTVTGSDFVAPGGGEGVGAAAGATPPELLSGELSTADMDVLLALQTQQAQAGGGQQGGAPDMSARRSSAGASRRSLPDRALMAASFARGSGTANCSVGPTTAAARLPPSLAPLLSPRNTAGMSEKPGMGPLGPVGEGNGAGAAGGGECVEPLNLSQLLQSNPFDPLAGFSYQAAGPRTGSFRSLGGLDHGGGVGGSFAATSIITVSGVDNAGIARQQLDLLVSSIHATINTDPAAGGASSYPMDDLDALELGDVLGQGGGGTVFKGKLGTLDVAVKLMELPKVEPSGDFPGHQRKASPVGTGGGGAVGPGGNLAVPASAEKVCLNARREMLRNATELAVQSRVSHPNIVQIYATYNDVVMVSKKGQPGCPGSTYRLHPAALNSAGPGDDGTKERRHVPCIAAAFELCDCGSLGSALATRTFPKTTYKEQGRDADGVIPLRQQMVLDMKGVYMTLLDVALALRHLHSMHLVHRDIKPANLLLKSNPRDPRGFTVKLADFGFVLHMSEIAEDGSRYAVADQACGTVTHMAPEALLAKAKIDSSVDIYAFGILMWEMFSGGVRPYPRLQPEKIPRAVYRGARPTFSEEVPPAYRNLALACWSTDPLRRPRASDVVVLLNGLLQELG